MYDWRAWCEVLEPVRREADKWFRNDQTSRQVAQSTAAALRMYYKPYILGNPSDAQALETIGTQYDIMCIHIVIVYTYIGRVYARKPI